MKKLLLLIGLVVTVLVFAINGLMQVLIGGKPFFYITTDILILRLAFIILFTGYIYNRIKK